MVWVEVPFGVLLGSLWAPFGSHFGYSSDRNAHPVVPDGMRNGVVCATITLDFGFHKYPAGTNTLDFIDLSNGTECAAFLHAIFRHYTDGELVGETNLDETLWVRSDPLAFDAAEGPRKPAQSKQIVMEFINRVAKITTDEALTLEETGEMHKRKFFPWAPDDPRIGEDHGYPVCIVAPMGDVPPTLEVSEVEHEAQEKM